MHCNYIYCEVNSILGILMGSGSMEYIYIFTQRISQAWLSYLGLFGVLACYVTGGIPLEHWPRESVAFVANGLIT